VNHLYDGLRAWTQTQTEESIEVEWSKLVKLDHEPRRIWTYTRQWTQSILRRHRQLFEKELTATTNSKPITGDEGGRGYFCNSSNWGFSGWATIMTHLSHRTAKRRQMIGEWRNRSYPTNEMDQLCVTNSYLNLKAPNKAKIYNAWPTMKTRYEFLARLGNTTSLMDGDVQNSESPTCKTIKVDIKPLNATMIWGIFKRSRQHQTDYPI